MHAHTRARRRKFQGERYDKSINVYIICKFVLYTQTNVSTEFHDAYGVRVHARWVYMRPFRAHVLVHIYIHTRDM